MKLHQSLYLKNLTLPIYIKILIPDQGKEEYNNKGPIF